MDHELTEQEVAEVEAAEQAEREAEQEELDRQLDELQEHEPNLDELNREEWLASWRDLRAQLGCDLSAIDTTKPVEWVPGAEGIIRRRERQSWVAKENEGKTQAALHLSAQITAAGGRVMYLDVENDKDEMAARAQPIFAGVGGDWSRLAYLPDLPLAAVHASDELMREWAFSLWSSDLLIIDSLTRVLAGLGLDENLNRDFADWMSAYVDPIAKYGQGCSVLMLDNTGHEGTHARGAINKSALVEAVYKVTGGRGVRPDTHGTMRLKLERSRSGLLSEYVACESGGGRFGPLVPQEGKAPKMGATIDMIERREGMAEMFAASGPSEYFSLADFRERWPKVASDNTFRQDIDALIGDGLVEAWSEATGDPRPGRAAHWKARRSRTFNPRALKKPSD
jgi:AAA domain